MGQWSEPQKEVSRYQTKSGGIVTVTRTFVDHLVSPPFVAAGPDAEVDFRAVTNVEISDDISEEHAKELLAWIANGYPRPMPDFFHDL